MTIITRREIEESYDTYPDNPIVIKDPGQFEGQCLWAPYFWEYYLNGFSDEDLAGVLLFVISEEDKAEWPELAEDFAIALEQSDSGFVYCTVIETEAEYNRLVAKLEREEEEQGADY